MHVHRKANFHNAFLNIYHLVSDPCKISSLLHSYPIIAAFVYAPCVYPHHLYMGCACTVLQESRKLTLRDKENTFLSSPILTVSKESQFANRLQQLPSQECNHTRLLCHYFWKAVHNDNFWTFASLCMYTWATEKVFWSTTLSADALWYGAEPPLCLPSHSS